jgi:hypothetical protein
MCNSRYGCYRKHDYAHRVAYELFYGPIPEGQVVRHKCDYGLCCNPAHLLVGTQADNLADMRSRGRQNYSGLCKEGDVPHNAHPEELRNKARELRRQGLKIREVAETLGLSVNTIRPWIHESCSYKCRKARGHLAHDSEKSAA